MKRIGLLTSGGDCQALNATMRGVVKSLSNSLDELEVYGFMNGYKGLIYRDYRMLTAKDFSGILTKGGTILGSSRQPFKLMRVPDENGLDKVEAMKQNYYKLRLDCLVILGGNGTQKTANLLREEGLNIIHLPKTIDNDLVVTDHTPGFGSAARYVAASVLEMAHDTYIYNTKSVLIAEIMGRDAGWLTAASVLARNSYSRAPHLIYLPEHPFSKEQFIEDIKAQFKQREHIVIAVSEGLRDADGHYISAETAAVDAFGHATLSGTGKCLEGLVAETFGCKVRSVEINVLQRCAAHMASATDIEESWQLGLKGVALALEGKSGEMSIVCRISDEPYQVIYDGADVQQIANAEKKIPTAWINEAGNDVTEEMVRYLRPLIHGSVAVPEQDSMPHYLFLGEAL